jgi:uncharacterized protein
MKGNYQVFDANRHVVEPRDVWTTRLAEPFRSQVQVGPTPLDLIVKGRPVRRPRLNYFEHPAYKAAFQGALESGFGAQANVRDMDREGIDAALLLPSAGLYAIWADHVDGALAAAMCQAYNDWLHEYCEADPKRLKGMALLPLQDPEQAATELRRAVNQLGFVAGFMLSSPLVSRKLHDRVYDPVYRTAEELGVPIVVSQGGGTVLPQLGQDRYDSYYAQEAVVDPFEAWLAVASLMGHHVLERYPSLKIGFFGAGCGWLPCWLDRLDEHWGGPFGTDAPGALPPMHLFRTQGFAACDPWESTVSDVVAEMGEGVILWGSQYPFPELLNFFPSEVDTIAGDPLLTEDQKRKILWSNAAALFHVNGG